MDVAILAVCPAWGPHEEAAFGIGARHEALLVALADLVAPLGGRIAATDGELVLAVVPDISAALWVAFDLAAHSPGACLGLAWGSDGLANAEASRARRLAWRAPPGVRCTAAFHAAMGTVPLGVGLFSVPQDLENRLGFEAHQLSDYRA